MACHCEILIDSNDLPLAQTILEYANRDALRIEKKFSRYRTDNIVHAINSSNGNALTVDDETAQLLNFAATCHELSDGLFDITAGVLRKAWAFGSDRQVGSMATLPTQDQIDTLLPLVGWHKVQWQAPVLRLPAGMQIDLGGIGKEYAVDRAVQLLKEVTSTAVLVNYGGDLHASHAPTVPTYTQINQIPTEEADAVPSSDAQQTQTGWQVGIESPRASTSTNRFILLQRGALCTSGNAYRYIDANGRRYGHILNPLTGWPVTQSPFSITVAGNSCTEAGVLATLAMLHGKHAESYLEEANAHYWCHREATLPPCKS